MKILFINGSPNKEGNTKKLADALVGNNKSYRFKDIQLWSEL